MAKVTIKDIAREAGVSISTVSNALNGLSVVSPETIAKVMEVADRLHYVPNLNGKNLKASSTKTIGLFAEFMGGSYMTELMYAMTSICYSEGYELNVFVTNSNRSIMTRILGGTMDGAVIVSSRLSADEEDALQEAGIPVVYLNAERAGRLKSSVCFDSYNTGRLAAEYLISKGVQRFGLMEGTDNYDSVQRKKGFCDVLAEKGLVLAPEFTWSGNLIRGRAREELKSYLDKAKDNTRAENLPQGIFACNDDMAIGCIEALKNAGVSVPHTVKIVGVDDIELDTYIRPSLTTIRTNFGAQGAEAVKLLLDMVKGQPMGRRICLSCELVERQSSEE